MDEQQNSAVKRLSLSDIKMEDGAEELLKSPTAQPYMRLAVALAAGRDIQAPLLEISQLPLESRYLWRVVSALKWAFVDLDDLSIVVDRKTLSPEDLDKVEELLRLRPLQFCLFLKALCGSEEMEQTMVQAIRRAKAAEIATL